MSLTVIDEDEAQTDSTFENLEKEIKHILGDAIFGIDDETMESVVGELLQDQEK